MKTQARKRAVFLLVLYAAGIVYSDTEGIKPGWYILYATSALSITDDGTRMSYGEKAATQRDDGLYDYLIVYCDKLGTLVCRTCAVDEDLIIKLWGESLLYHGKTDLKSASDTGFFYFNFEIEKSMQGLDLIQIVQIIEAEELRKEPERYKPFSYGMIYHYRYFSELLSE